VELTAPLCKNPLVRKSKEEIASGFDLQGRLWLIKGCHAKDDDDDDETQVH
jgi:hypothetical protein